MPRLFRTLAALATVLVAVAAAGADAGFTGERMSLNFQQLEVRRALQLVADFGGLNLVVGDAVGGSVTLRLADVPWDEALHVILNANDLGTRDTGNVLMVAPAADIAAREQLELSSRRALAELAPLTTEFVRIRYAAAAPLAELLSAEDAGVAVSERGSIHVDARTNSLILTDTDANLVALKDMIANLDTPVPQVQIEARIVTANDTVSEQLGIRWGVEWRNDGVVLAPRRTSSRTAAEPLPRSTRSIGVAGGDVAALSAEIVGAGYWLDVELSALASRGQAQIIARPKVVTADKRTAIIEAGVEIPYQQATKSGATSIAFKDAVLQLQVTPRIAPDGGIVMDLSVKQDTVGQIYHGVPSINTTRIVTQVLVQDGDTLVLGGIFQTDRHHLLAHTPLLGQLPVLGRLFRRRSERDDRQELFIFITPTVLADAAAAQEQA